MSSTNGGRDFEITDDVYTSERRLAAIDLLESEARSVKSSTSDVDILHFVMHAPPKDSPTGALAREIDVSEQTAFGMIVATLNPMQRQIAMESLHSSSGLIVCQGPHGIGKIINLAGIAVGHVVVGKKIRCPRPIIVTAPSSNGVDAVVKLLKDLISQSTCADAKSVKICGFTSRQWWKSSAVHEANYGATMID
jgi:hypothetical protein